MIPWANTALRSTVESISDFLSAFPRWLGRGKANGGEVATVEAVANSSQVAEGRGTEVASKETRLFCEPRRGRMAFFWTRTTSELEEEPVEERDEARARVAIVIGEW